MVASGGHQEAVVEVAVPGSCVARRVTTTVASVVDAVTHGHPVVDSGDGSRHMPVGLCMQSVYSLAHTPALEGGIRPGFFGVPTDFWVTSFEAYSARCVCVCACVCVCVCGGGAPRHPSHPPATCGV